MYRYITLCDGTDMGGELIIFHTNAPVSLLIQLEEQSCKASINGEEIPIWKEVVEANGFQFEYIDSCQNVTAHGTSDDWLMEHDIGSKITEHYIIENQLI